MTVQKRDQIMKFYKQLLDFNIHFSDPINEDKCTKFVAHSMVVSLNDVNTIYEFFKDYMEEFTTSKVGIKNLCST